MNKGSYILLFEIKSGIKVCIGKLGEFEFPAGYYIYVGSALNSLTDRVKRHLSKEKKFHWHIDYILPYSKILLVLMIPTDKKIECRLARKFTGRVLIRSFGSTDCKCKSHLFYYKTLAEALEDAYKAVKEILKET